MRKLLLIAAVMFSLGSMAQKPLNSLKNVNFSTKAMKMNRPTENMHTRLFGKAAKAQAKAPDGTPKTFYLDFLNSCYGTETIFGINALPEYHRATDIIYGDNNKVYIKNMMCPNSIGGYLEGSIDGNTITLTKGQIVSNIQGYDILMYKGIMDQSGNVTPDTDSDYQLTIDPESGIISNSEDILCLCMDYNSSLMTYTYCASLTFCPENLFPAAEQHEYTYDYSGLDSNNNEVTKTDVKSTIEVVNLGEISYIKGLMPESYEDSWMLVENVDDSLKLSLPQNVEEDITTAFTQGNYLYFGTRKFVYDASSNCYILNDYGISDMFMYQNNPYITEDYTNLRIKATTTGINKVESSNADVVSTQYFDISGRRINSAQKGINVKVMKYSDGTTKTVKVIK